MDRPFLTLTAPQSLLLKQLLLIRVQSEALKRMEGWWRGYAGINDTNSFSLFFPCFSLSFPSYLDSAVSTPLHLQSDLCYSSLWFLCVQRRQDVSNWKGCDGAGGPSLGLGGPQRSRGQGEPVSHWHVGLDGSIQSQQAWGSAISSSSVRRGAGQGSAAAVQSPTFHRFPTACLHDILIDPNCSSVPCSDFCFILLHVWATLLPWR